ncbi:hypothetical protein [Paraburkholderia phytofirmans]|uniref:hypothetical protein n=1 Tax=Paraburkholderia phytofirmans TaxID=261302 RepID=UPI0038BB3946
MTQRNLSKSPKTFTPAQVERRTAMVERINERAMLNAEMFAAQMANIRALARSARRPNVSLADRLGIIASLEVLATQGESGAELDAQCMSYAVSLGPDDLEEFEALMGTGETEQAATH